MTQYALMTKDNEFYMFDSMKELKQYALKLKEEYRVVEYNEDKIAKAFEDDTVFEKLNQAEYDRFDLDKKVACNGLKRLQYNLKKIGLTLDQWDIWCIL